MQDEPIEYIKRTSQYYQALGYGEPYKWAHFDDVPFTHPNKALHEATVSIVTTAAPYQADKGEQGPGAPYNAAAKFFDVYVMPTHTMPDLCISHVAIDRDHTTAADIGSYFPLNALKHASDENRIGKLADNFYGLPTNRSIRTTIEIDCQKLLGLCQRDDVDIAVLVPNCPVCHQSVSLAARALEAAGIVSVVMGCAKDIVEHIGVPRFLFSDFPLGNAAGLPGDNASQNNTLDMALELAVSATQPRTTHQSHYHWPGSSEWKMDYSNADKLSAREIARRKQEFDKGKRQAKAIRD